MAQAWESDAIKNAGKKYQEAQKRGDQNGMKAASDEANRLRNQSGYNMNGGSSNSSPSITNGSAYKNSGAGKNYESQVHGIGTPNVNSEENLRRQMGYGGGGQSSSNAFDDQLAYSQRAYQDMLDRIEEQNRLAVQQGVGRLESNRGTLNQSYDETARQAYIAKMQSQKGLSQTLAGQGITGGGSESARLALETSYGNNINTNEQARQNALTGLDQSISDLRSTGDLNLVEQQLALQQQQLADSQNIYAQKISQDNWLKQFEQGNQQNEMQNYRDTIGAYAEDFTAEINRLLALGYSEDHQYIKELKAARSEKLAAMQSAAASAQETDWDRWYKQQQLQNQTNQTNYNVGKPYYNPRTGTSSKGSNKPRLTESQAHKAYYENGITTPEVVEALRFYYGNNVVSDREQESNALRNAGRGLGKVSR